MDINYYYDVGVVRSDYASYFCMWCFLDCKSGKCIQVIDPAENTKLKGFFSCVSCIALDGSESWLVRFYVIRM